VYLYIKKVIKSPYKAKKKKIMVCSVFQLYLAHNLYSTCSIGIHVAKKYLVGVWSIFIHMVMY